jgi:hypothetical protein
MRIPPIFVRLPGVRLPGRGVRGYVGIAGESERGWSRTGEDARAYIFLRLAPTWVIGGGGVSLLPFQRDATSQI